jgi:hypothetical protein
MIAFAPDRPAVAAKRRSLSVLDSVQIAQPCPADWEAMHLVEGFAYRRVRHCAECNLRVYNLSAMPRTEAEELLRGSGGRMCVRLYRRHDGTVLTADCSCFRRAVDVTTAGARQMGWILACGFAAVVGAGLWAVGLNQSARDPNRTNLVQSGLDQLSDVRPIAWVIERLNPTPMGGMVSGTPIPLMGDMAPSPNPGWIAGGRSAPAIQGELYVPPVPPALLNDPQRWPEISEPPTPPL